MTVNEIREKLVQSGEYSVEEANAIKGKQNLMEAFEALEKENELFQSLGQEEPPWDTSETEQDESTTGPSVFDLLREDELIDGNPTTTGLRRVAQIMIGPIVSSRVVDFVAPNTDERAGRATVVYEIVIEDRRGYLDLQSPPPVIILSDIADCWWGNAGDNKFAIHPAATAATRAEGRCLRKLLNISTITAEEGSQNNPDEVVAETEYGADDNIQKSIIILIKSRCEALGIDILKLIKSQFENKYVALEQLSREDGGKLVQLVNTYQQGEVPDDIKV